MVEITPDMCMKAGKCMMKEKMTKMSEEDYKNLTSEEKDKEDEKEIMSKEEKPGEPEEKE